MLPPDASVTSVRVGLALWWVATAARLALAAARQPSRRAALAAWLVACTSWSSAPFVLVGSGPQDTWPGPGELLYVPAYLGMIAFVVMDVGWQPGESLRTTTGRLGWGVAALGAVLGVALVVLGSTIGLDLGLVQPLEVFVDLTLLCYVLASAATGHHPWEPRTAVLAGLLLVLAVLDTLWTVQQGAGVYEVQPVLLAVWAAVLSLFVGVAVRPPGGGPAEQV